MAALEAILSGASYVAWNDGIQAREAIAKARGVHQFHVRYSYLATGMEGRADERDFGLIAAESPKAACEAIALREYPEDIATRQFFLGCLTAIQIP